jgi:signal transduction histidine kinase
MQVRSSGRNLSRSSLVYVILIASLTVVYLGTVGFLTWLVVDVGLLDGLLDRNLARQLVAGVATVLVLLIYAPTRGQVETWTDRILLRGWVDHRQAVLAFSRQLRRVQTLDPLLDAMVDLIAGAISPRFCAILLPPRPGSPFMTVRQTGAVPVDLGTVLPDDPLLVRAMEAGEAVLMETELDGSVAWRVWWDLGVALVVPLVVGADLIGLLVVGPKNSSSRFALGSKRQNAGYSRDELWMLNALADQSAVAIETARLYDQSLRRATEETVLFEMAAAISSSLEEDEVLAATANQLIHLLQVDGCVISDWDKDNDALVLLLAHFDKKLSAKVEPGDTFALSDHPAGQILREKQSQVISAIENPHEARRIPLIASGHMYVVLQVPLVARDDVIGLIELYSSAPRRTFTAREIQLGQTLVNQAAVTIANARLYRQARRRADELGALVETGMIVSTIMGVQGALERISEEMVRLLNAAGCRVSSWDQDRDQVVSWLDIHVPDGPWVPGPYGTVYSLESRPDFALALQERCPLSVTWPLFTDGQQRPLTPSTAQTLLILPLIARDEVLGVIELGAFQTERMFTDWEIRLAQTLVNLAATAIENARTYEEQRIAARNLERKVDARTAELNAALHTLQVESSKREAILEGVADGVLFAGAVGEITLFNAAAERLLGVPRQIALGNSVEGFVEGLSLPGEAWKQIPRRWAEMRSRPDIVPFVEQQYEVENQTFNVRLTPVVQDGEFLGTVAVWRDVTKDVELNRAKSAFVSSVAHELRIPMTSIKGYTDLMLMQAVGPLNEKQIEFLHTVQTNADRLTSLVNDLLDISRVETGRIRLKLETVDLNRVTKDVIAALRPRADEKSQKLENQVPEALPAVRADADRVVQILVNLVGNAIAYTPENGHICVSGHPVNGKVQLNVSDNGVGIAAEEQARIWERFYRSEHPAVSGQVGTGLGLSIVRSLVELQGGKVWVESELGVGSTFSMTLPVAVHV